jgi:hypothetical protein
VFAPVQSEFAAALLDAGRPVPTAVTANTAGVPAKRFAVYRNNVVAGLVNALRARFSAIERLVGKEFFAAMARVFVAAHPPRSPLLMVYGDRFPAFIATFSPAAEWPYLADVARLEAARTRAYHAADAKAADPAPLHRLGPEELARVTVLLHPSVQIVRSAHPVVTIWAMNSGERKLQPIADWRGEDALIARPQADVVVRLLPPGGAAFLQALTAALPLQAAAATGAADHPDFDLTANLAGLIGAGLATDFTIRSATKDPERCAP